MEKKEKEQESYSSTVNNNTILLSFEGWIKYIEGFIRGISTAKTVEAASVLDCIGEVLEYMQTLRKNLLALLTHCEMTLDRMEKLEEENKLLKEQLSSLMVEDKEKKNGKNM